MQRRILPLFLVLAMLGPLLAGPLFLLVMAAIALLTGEDPSGTLRMFGKFPDIIKNSYLLGLAPAVISGLVLALVWRRLPRRKPLLLAAPLVAAIATFASILVQTSLTGDTRIDANVLALLGLFAIAGALSALILAALVCVWPDKAHASL